MSVKVERERVPSPFTIAEATADAKSLDRLTPNQRRAIRLLAKGWTQSAVAHRSGVAPRTVERWMSDPHFREALVACQSEYTRSSRARLGAEVPKSIKRLVAIRDDPQTPPSVAVRAAVVLLDRAGFVAPEVHIDGNMEITVNADPTALRDILAGGLPAYVAAKEQGLIVVEEPRQIIDVTPEKPPEAPPQADPE